MKLLHPVLLAPRLVLSFLNNCSTTLTDEGSQLALPVFVCVGGGGGGASEVYQYVVLVGDPLPPLVTDTVARCM